jgi:hypothetical protein
MITLTAGILGFYTILIAVISAGLAFMIGFHLGQGSEAKEVYQYWQENEMSLTEELIKDRYTLINRGHSPKFTKPKST